jgi:hypothetical protein
MLSKAQIVERIKKALARDGTHTLADLFELLQSGAARMFSNQHGCVITEIISSPRKRWLNIWLVAGELPGVLKLQDQVIEYARSRGCEYLTTSARTGWTRTLSDQMGWKTRSINMVHDL